MLDHVPFDRQARTYNAFQPGVGVDKFAAADRNSQVELARPDANQHDIAWQCPAGAKREASRAGRFAKLGECPHSQGIKIWQLGRPAARCQRRGKHADAIQSGRGIAAVGYSGLGRWDLRRLRAEACVSEDVRDTLFGAALGRPTNARYAIRWAIDTCHVTHYICE